MRKKYFLKSLKNKRIELPEMTRASFGLQVMNLILKKFILADLKSYQQLNIHNMQLIGLPI